jgi:thiamine-monophosphate kinase
MRKKGANLRSRESAGGLSAGGHGELALIGQVRKQVAGQRVAGRKAGYTDRVRLGIGDDCALLRLRKGEVAAVTTDLSIDGRHFHLDWHPAEAVGHRTLARGLSDLAAMGGRPVGAFLSLGLPRELAEQGRRARSRHEDRSWVVRFFTGLLALAEQHEVSLAGGDLAESPVAVADVVLVGAVPGERALLRSGARPGDRLYVTGALGGAAAGLARLAEWAKAGHGKGRKLPAALAAELSAHLYPHPRIAQGLWLQRRGRASAAIDISDGLSTDLAHLCEESRLAAEVDVNLLPVHAGASLEQALHGGEDYELLFTVPESTRIPGTIAGVAVTEIGRMVRRRAGRAQITLLEGRMKTPLTPSGWEHFS